LKRIESDTSFDYPDEVLERFDFVVASIHGRFKMDGKAQTDRLLRAISTAHHDHRRLHDRAAAAAAAGLRHRRGEAPGLLRACAAKRGERFQGLSSQASFRTKWPDSLPPYF
jgi:hypothetical protein